MSDLATINQHIAYAREARDRKAGKEAAHHLRNAGAALAQAQKAAMKGKGKKVRCGECGRSTVASRPAKDKIQLRAMRQAFREAKTEMGVDAVAAEAPATDSEGRIFGYSTKILSSDPNA